MIVRSNYGLGDCDPSNPVTCLPADLSAVPPVPLPQDTSGASTVSSSAIPATYSYQFLGSNYPVAPQPTSINPLYLIGGAVGLVLLISLLGGRRR